MDKPFVAVYLQHDGKMRSLVGKAAERESFDVECFLIAASNDGAQERVQRYRGLVESLRLFASQYEYIGCIAPQVSVSADALEVLFLTGYALDLHLFQPAYSASIYTLRHELRRKTDSYVRFTPIVESHVAIFSQQALNALLPVLESMSLMFGQESVWARVLNYSRMAVVDAIVLDRLQFYPGQAPGVQEFMQIKQLREETL